MIPKNIFQTHKSLDYIKKIQNYEMLVIHGLKYGL